MATVLWAVRAFADLLNDALAAQPEARGVSSFEDSLRAFEHLVAALPSSGQGGDTGGQASGADTASWAQALGVALPCTREDVKRAFRRLAFKTHPDRPGGSHEQFLRAQALLEEALASWAPARGQCAAARSYSRCRQVASELQRVHFRCG